MRATNTVATRNRRKKVIKRAEGSWGTRHITFKVAKQTVIRAGQYSYRDRKAKKRDFRKLWIARLNAALKAKGHSYSVFMHQMKLAQIEINRKMLSEMAINNPVEFNTLVDSIMANHKPRADKNAKPRA